MTAKSTTKGFRLTEGDVEILTSVYSCRRVTIDHVMALTGRSRRATNRRLVRLAERRYLYRKRFPFQKYIYTINKEAVPILVERGVAPKEELDLRVQLGELTELFLKHALMITDIHVCLELAERNTYLKLLEWREGKDLEDNVRVVEDGKEINLPVRPDAYFVLQDTRRPEGQNRANFFLEVDRSTTTNKRFQRKIKGYWHYYEQGLHTQKYGIKNFRVITTTLTTERALNLCTASFSVLPRGERKYYYFAPVDSFSCDNPERVLEDIFMTPQDFETDKRYSLIPRLATSS